MIKTDLNCDLGESFGNYKCGMDEEILPYISSANVACGFHASDPVVMQKTVRLAKQDGVHIGAHPGFPDLDGFGRRRMELTPEEITAITIYQIGALSAFCAANSIPMQHVKPHGALYNMAVKNPAIADAICAGITAADPSLILLAPCASEMERSARCFGLPFAGEVFADRAYEDDGSLVARGKPGAMVTDEDEAVRRVIRMVTEGVVTTVTGKEIPVHADSICIHSDSPAALAFARKIRAALIAQEILIAPIKEVIA